jgi:hypothetical protein
MPAQGWYGENDIKEHGSPGRNACGEMVKKLPAGSSLTGRLLMPGIPQRIGWRAGISIVAAPSIHV